MPPFIPRKGRRSLPPHPQASVSTQRSEQKPTLFDTLDAKPHRRTLEGNKAFLDSLDSGSSGSELCNSESEASDLGSPRSRKVGEEDEEEIDWEDAIEYTTSTAQSGVPGGDLELTIEKNTRFPLVDTSNKKKGPSKIERRVRMQTHCMHVQCLLYHNFIRNAWVCDREVQKILVTHLTPGVRKEWERWQATTGLGGTTEGASGSVDTLHLREGKGQDREKGKQREWGGEAVKVDIGPRDSRGPDPLVRFLKVLVGFWKKRFRICAPGLRKMGYKVPSVLESEVVSFQNDPHDPKLHGERVRGVEEFREMARKCEGSRDVGAQLFTALLKGLGLEARLVANLQVVGFGWSKVEDAVATNRKGLKGTCVANDGQDDVSGDSGSEGTSTEGEGQTATGGPNSKARETTRLSSKRRAKHKGGRGVSTELRDSSNEGSSDGDGDSGLLKSLATAPALMTFDRDLAFPIYWSEVFSSVTNHYIPVDALVLKTIATSPATLSSFEPRGSKAEKAKQVIPYVISYSSDGTAKDVTVRYLKRNVWPGKTKGFRMPLEKVPIYNSRGKVKRYHEFDWFKSVMSLYERPINKRTWVDDLEETGLQPANPTRDVKAKRETLQGYKNSAEFVLERHLHREEAIIPGRKHVKNFVIGKGEKAKEEKVYRRSDVASCKSSESWHKEGREIREGEQPIKFVPMRAVTLIRKREIEQAEADGGGKVMQGLYARDQTQWIIPPPIVDGVIPKNAFGNMDCYVPSMVPEGAVHIRLRGTAKVARRLGIDYAEAVVGFDFGAQRAVPVIEGVVVAAENEQVMVDAWHEAEEERRRKEDGKREKVALATWRKFLMGLRIIEQVREEYGGNQGEHLTDEVNPFVNKKQRNNPQRNVKDGLGIPGEYAEVDRGEGILGRSFRGETDNSKDVGDSGFTPSGHGGVGDGGGFIVEDTPGEKRSATSNTSKQTPISLFSLHRRATEGVPGTRDSEADSDEDAEPTPIFQGRSREMVESSPKVDSTGKSSKRDAPMTPQSMDRRTSRRTKNKGLVRRDSAISGTNPEASQNSQGKWELPGQDIDYSALSDFGSEIIEGKPVPESIATPLQVRREVPRRTAARSGDGAIRSCYFELSDDDSKGDGGRSSESPGEPALKKRKTHSTVVRQSQRTAK
ncbi:MAG: hypothetical protein M1839_000337 [Geoglossum umbratile]|nr:MAG: hypothetical protein M1839_000337 [Geoglossum umbratile]